MPSKKVICLHGYSMNSEWLQSWLRPFEQQFTGELEFIYPQGPIECPPEEVANVWSRINAPLPPHRLGKGKNWCWYRATDDKPPIYSGIDTSLAMLDGTFAEHGPIDGVIGWSQGTIMATVLIALQRHRPHPRFVFNWAVLGAGALPADPRFNSDMTEPLALPTLHVIGSEESAFMKKRCDALFQRFKNPQRLEPPVGHVLPLRYPQYMAQIDDWIRTQMDRS